MQRSRLTRLALVSALFLPQPMLAQSSMTGAVCGADTVELHTPTGVLHGSLKCPSTPAPWPVAVIIAGSGPTDRDGNTPLLPGKNNSLLMIADGLAARGIASIRYDKRAIGASRGAAVSEADLRFDMYADDAAGWVRALQGDKRFSTVTVVGHSEGSLLGMLAARLGGADAYASLEGAGRAAGVVIHEQLSKQLPPDMLADADKVIATLKSGQTTPDFPAPLASLFRPSVQPYLASWFRYDPAEEIKRLTVPVLIVQGTTDVQVSMDDAHALAAAKPTATMLTVDGMNHVLKMVPTLDQAAQMKAYTDPTLPVAPQVIDAISSLIHGTRRRPAT